MRTIYSLLFICLSLPLTAQVPQLKIPVGHPGGISHVDVSADGEFFLTSGQNGSVKLWDAQGRCLATLQEGLTGLNLNAYVSPDGQKVVECTDNQTMVIDVAREINNPDSSSVVVSIQTKMADFRFSEDGKMLLARCERSCQYCYLTGTDRLATDILDRDLEAGMYYCFSTVDGSLIYKTSTAALNRFAILPDQSRVAMHSPKGITLFKDVESGKISAIPMQLPLWRVNPTMSLDEKMMYSSDSLFNTETGKFLGKIESSWDGHVAFSGDGRYLIVASETSKVYDLNHLDKGPKWVFESPLTGLASSVFVVCSTFPGQARIILSHYIPAGSTNKHILYDLDSGKQIAELFEAEAAEAGSAIFAPDDQSCAIASGNRVQLLDFQSGTPLRTLVDSKVVSRGFNYGDDNNITTMHFTADGASLRCGTSGARALVFDTRSSRLMYNHESTGIVFPPLSFYGLLEMSPDGQTLYKLTPDLIVMPVDKTGAADRKMLLDLKKKGMRPKSMHLSKDGKWLMLDQLGDTTGIYAFNMNGLKTEPVHIGGKIVDYTILPDSRRVAVMEGEGIQYFNSPKNPVLSIYDISTRKRLQTFHLHPDSLDLVSWDCFVNLFPGKMTASNDSKWLAYTTGDGYMTLFDLDSMDIDNCWKGHDGYVYSLAFSQDGKRLISTGADQTTRIWNIATGQEMAQIVLFGEKDWAIVSPDGLFDASPGAMNHLYFTVGTEAIELDQLKERYYEPGLLSKLMGFSNESLRAVPKFANLPLYPKLKARIHLDTLHLDLQKRNGGLGKISLFINGKEVQEDINPQRQEKLDLDLSHFQKYFRYDTLNQVSIRAYNADGWLKSQAYTLPYNAKGAKGGGSGSLNDLKSVIGPATLYAVIVGTSNYSGEKLDLRFPDKDAASMAEAVKAAGTELFGKNVQVKMLQSASATPEGVSSKANVAAALQELATKARPQDILVLYFSGHGVNYGASENAQFYYLTKDIASEDLSDPEIRKNYTISSNELTQWINAIPAQKQVMILDACNSGKLVEDFAAITKKDLSPAQIRALDRMKDRTGMFILTGSAANKVSYEASQYGQGLLTYSLLQGMSGLALTEDKRVDVMSLFQYSRDKVPELAKGVGGIQTPILAFPTSGGSFDIGIVNDKVKIPVAQVKPVFIRNVFQDENTFDDGLGLSQALGDYFQGMTAKGSQAEVIYVDVSNYENAWSLKGRYTVEGEVVKVTGRLFKGKTAQHDFVVNGKKSDVNGLAEAILEAVWAKVNGE